MHRNEKFTEKRQRALDDEVLVLAEKDKPLTYVSRRGIVEIHYGTENGTVEWTKDMYDYVREELDDGRELFDPSFCTKEKETGKRYWFACIVCPCTLYKDENLCFHVNGQKHQKRALEKLEQDQQQERQKSRPKYIKREDYSDRGGGGESRYRDRIGRSRTTRSHLKEKLENTKFPFVGLEYITEYLNPGNPNSDPQYQCLLDGCKKAWGTAEEMFNHLTSNKESLENA